MLLKMGTSLHEQHIDNTPPAGRAGREVQGPVDRLRNQEGMREGGYERNPG